MAPGLAAYNVAYGSTGLLCLVVAGNRLWNVVRYPGDYLARMVLLAFVFTASAFLFAVPAFYVAFDHLTGVPNGATLAVYVSIPLTSASFLVVLSAWTGQPRRVLAEWVLGYAALIAAMVVLFVQGSPDDGEHPIDFDSHYASHPVISRFLLLYYTGFAVAMTRTAWMSRRYSQLAAAERPWLARGLRWTSWGAVLAVLYCALKVIAVVGIMAGARTEALSNVWAPLSATVGALMIALGLTMPSWAPPTGAALGRVLAYRQLYPLWRLLTESVPSVVLEPRRSSWWGPLARRWTLRDTTHRLYRRAVEIHDARLALGPWLSSAAVEVPPPADTSGQGATPADREAEAAREAALLVGAVRAKALGKPAGRPQHPPRDPGEEWEDQLGWLLAVARQLNRR